MHIVPVRADSGRLGIAACATGLAQAALGIAAAYAKEREQFGRAIAESRGRRATQEEDRARRLRLPPRRSGRLLPARLHRGTARREGRYRNRAFTHRARAWFAAHGITRIERIVTDNGACYRAGAFARALLGSRHQRITPHTPLHNGKVERYNRIIAEEFLYARTWSSEDQRREALGVWNIHYNYHRPHSGAGGQPPATRLREGVTNVQASYN
jgi:transposase InsO family protein